ncbi:MAG: hypothetical protein IJH71_01805 [Eubacterium sp.]|nr:hypothetical protein [Eubacterium sp.]
MYRSSFVIESENQVPMKGFICSTNDKVDTEIHEFSGLRQEISFYFKGKLAVSGMEYEGDLVLITNGGEYNIPYHILVTNPCIETEDVTIRDMEDFCRLYREDRTKAASIFFTGAFEKVCLKDRPEEKILYHSLMKSRQRNQIVEEFMTAAGYKEVTRLVPEEKHLVLDVGKEEDTLTFTLSDPGYIEGAARSEKGQVGLSFSRFTSDDFTDGKLTLTIRKNKDFVMGSDVIYIETIRQSFAIPVEWWGTLPAVSREKERRSLLRRQKAELMHNYLYFRTGSIGFEDFSESSNRVIDDLYQETGDPEWKLYKAHLHLMEDQREAASECLKEVEESRETKELSRLMQNYKLYLAALYEKTPEAISNAVISIRHYYEATDDHKAEALWMLIYLDREYVYNKSLQYDTIRQLFDAGNNSCLLYYEACEILNDNPSFMKELGPFELSIFRWGLRYGYVSLALSHQFAKLALKVKYFNKSIYYIAQKLYKVEPDDLFLQLICSLLIKGNRTGKEYHQYFRSAVEANLKIIGLNEFFIRSMNFETFDEIPQRVLIYFTYSNSLDYLEKAYLYTNVLKHEKEYEEVYGAYHSKMLPFVKEQLTYGRINEHLAMLYTYFLDQILAGPENWKAVCDVLFFRKLTCANKKMAGLYVSCPETGKETYYPLSSGVANIESFNDRTTYYFVDANEQRYIKDIEYTEKSFLSLSRFPADWIRKNLDNRKILLVKSDLVDENIKADDLAVLERIAFNEEYEEWIRIRAVEKLLTFYENHQQKDELSRWLSKVDYSNISSGYRKRLMDYYMEVGMIENTFFGIELYGSTIMGAEKRLKLAEFGVDYYQGGMDETTLSLAYSAFMRKKNTRKTLRYLMEHFRGETEDLLTIWERSRKFELDTADFERRILDQSMFSENDTDGVFPVYESFFRTNPEDEMISGYLEYALRKEMEGSMELPDFMHMVAGRQIMNGNISGRDSRIHFLYYFAGKTEWYEQIREPVSFIIGQFLEEEFYLPVYHTYGDLVDFPIDYQEMTFLTYKGRSGSRVFICYEIEDEQDYYREQPLTEVMPGVYVCQMHFFRSDHVNYRLEEDGVRVDNLENVVFETMDYDGADSRFFALNRLGGSEAQPMDLELYLFRAWFADHGMQLM